MPRVVLFIFGGRKPNIEIQLPFLWRILDQNPDVEVHLWDLCRDRGDSRYLRSIPARDRFTVRTEFYQGNGRATSGQNRVWKSYAALRYQNTTFVKIDDDVVFLDTDRLGSFVQATIDNPDSVISAATINHGASTHLIHDLWAMYETLDIPLLDVHLSTEYCERSHRWFLDNWQNIISKAGNLVPATSWVSINAIAYQYKVGKRIADLLGTRPPEQIMDREYPHRDHRGRQTRCKVGDEGAANMQPLLIHTGFVAAHLNFGPQLRAMDATTLDVIRKGYAEIGEQYLGERA